MSWDAKMAGQQVVMARLFLQGALPPGPAAKPLYVAYKQSADYYVCANMPGNELTYQPRTPGEWA